MSSMDLMIGTLAWVKLGHENDSVFMFGCADGSLHLYLHIASTVSCS